MKNLTLYIADNYLLTRVSLRKYFENNTDIKVIGDFSSAEECLEAMKKLPADIVITDIVFNGTNGIDATRIIKDKYPKTKVIIYSAYDDDKKVLAALSSGACAYVVKNAKKDLKSIISLVCQGGFWMDLELTQSAFSKLPVYSSDLDNKYQDLKNTLTERELEVLKLMIAGYTNSQIAKEIVVSTNTAKAHVGSILEKFAVKDRVQAVVKALRANIY